MNRFRLGEDVRSALSIFWINTGATGPQGVTGPTGPQGIQGVTGPTGVSPSGPFNIASGSATNPSYSFTGNTGSGLYLSATNELALAVNGSRVFRVGTNFTTFESSDPVQSALNITNSTSNRNYSFLLGGTGGGVLSLTTGAGANTLALRVTGAGIDRVVQKWNENQTLVTSGTPLEPGYAFYEEPSLGICRISTGTMRFCNGLATGYYSLQVDNPNGISGYLSRDLHNIGSMANFQVYGAAFTANVYYSFVQNTSITNFNFARYDNNAGGVTGAAWRVRGDGATFADGAYSSAGADYAEYFESFDGKEIPVGSTVKLQDGKISLAVDGDEEQVIGVVRPKNTNGSIVIGNSAEDYWNGMFEKDEFGQFVIEYVDYYKWVDEDGKFHNYYSHQVPDDVKVPENKEVIPNQPIRKLNPNYIPNQAYIPRSQRVEWHIIGLLGQIPVKNGSILGNNWQLIKNVGDGSIAKIYLVK